MNDWSHYCIVVADEPIDHDEMPLTHAKAKEMAKEMVEAGECQSAYIYGVSLLSTVEPAPAKKAAA
jgi:hypothetical protein